MKKFFVLILSFLYMASSCEASVYMHYCMGKPVSISFSPGKTGNCQRCGMKKTRGMGCCKDEQKIIKSDKSQKVTDLSPVEKQVKRYLIIPPVSDSFQAILYHASANKFHLSHGPPPGSESVPLYLMNGLFLI